MRTTIDVPDELLRAAKKKAADQGEKLKDVFIRGLEHEVGIEPAPKSYRVKLPLIDSGEPATVNLTNDDIAEIFAAEDVERFGRAFE